MAQDAERLRGSLDLLILKALSLGPRHGYGVAEWIRQSTRDVVLIEEGTLYPALHRLEARGLIDSEWGVSDNNRRAKYYSLAAAGRRELKAETSAWHQHAEAMARALGKAAPES
ncbi:MAG TPA: PadR family transcriptional regulator [Gemmatimonadales bacterium]|nr:PadR family transcriptional regulator [Gemmatimonadales bacterium]